MAYAVLYEYQTAKRTGDVFLDMGIGYALFAKHERHIKGVQELKERRIASLSCACRIPYGYGVRR